MRKSSEEDRGMDSFWGCQEFFDEMSVLFLRFLTRKRTFPVAETYVSLMENVRFSIGEHRKCGESILFSAGGFSF